VVMLRITVAAVCDRRLLIPPRSWAVKNSCDHGISSEKQRPALVERRYSRLKWVFPKISILLRKAVNARLAGKSRLFGSGLFRCSGGLRPPVVNSFLGSRQERMADSESRRPAVIDRRYSHVTKLAHYCGKA
jgi:hypothetical protein